MRVDFARLTERQMECLRRQCDGMTHAKVGESLGISKNTVKAHLRTAYATLYGRSRSSYLPGSMTCYLLGQYDKEASE